MSRAYLEPHTTPVKNFLEEELGRLNISGAQGNILMRMPRDTYAWEECSETGRRFDRARISYRQLHERTGLPVSTLRDALEDLIERKIIIQYEAGKGRRPSLLGINSNTSEWVGKRPVKNIKSAYPLARSASRSSTENQHTTECSSTENRTSTETRSSTENQHTTNRSGTENHHSQRPNSTGKTAEPRASRIEQKPPERNSLKKDPPIVPQRGTEGANDYLILDSKTALENQGMDLLRAKASAERAYVREFGRSLTYAETGKLETFLSLSEMRGSMLAFWLDSIVPASHLWDMRHTLPPDQRRDVPKLPYYCVEKIASKAYHKARLRKRKGQTS